MSILRSKRMLNNIENGAIDEVALETSLSDLTKKGEFQTIIENDITRVAVNEQAREIVTKSPSAITLILNNTQGIKTLFNSSYSLISSALKNNATFVNEVFTIPKAKSAFAAYLKDSLYEVLDYFSISSYAKFDLVNKSLKNDAHISNVWFIGTNPKLSYYVVGSSGNAISAFKPLDGSNAATKNIHANTLEFTNTTYPFYVNSWAHYVDKDIVMFRQQTSNNLALSFDNFDSHKLTLLGTTYSIFDNDNKDVIRVLMGTTLYTIDKVAQTIDKETLTSAVGNGFMLSSPYPNQVDTIGNIKVFRENNINRSVNFNAKSYITNNSKVAYSDDNFVTWKSFTLPDSQTRLIDMYYIAGTYYLCTKNNTTSIKIYTTTDFSTFTNTYSVTASNGGNLSFERLFDSDTFILQYPVNDTTVYYMVSYDACGTFAKYTSDAGYNYNYLVYIQLGSTYYEVRKGYSSAQHYLRKLNDLTNLNDKTNVITLDSDSTFRPYKYDGVLFIDWNVASNGVFSGFSSHLVNEDGSVTKMFNDVNSPTSSCKTSDFEDYPHYSSDKVYFGRHSSGQRFGCYDMVNKQYIGNFMAQYVYNYNGVFLTNLSLTADGLMCNMDNRSSTVTIPIKKVEGIA